MNITLPAASRSPRSEQKPPQRAEVRKRSTPFLLALLLLPSFPHRGKVQAQTAAPLNTGTGQKSGCALVL